VVLRPALASLGHIRPGDPDFDRWASLLFYVPSVIGGACGLLGGYLTDRFGRRRVLVWSIVLYAGSALAASQAAQDPTVELKGDTFTTDYYGVAVKKGANDLAARVNRILEQYRQDGGWQASYDKWLSPTLGSASESAKAPVPRYK
jgi:hypothetical protein